jgi:ribosomal-protein-alanine N-acetyltransferase
MPAEIRTARASDIGALVAIENAAFETDRLSRRSFQRLLGSRSAEVLVACADGKVAGYCLLLFRRGGSAARLYSIATDDSGQGVGRALLAEAEQTAARRGCRSIRLEVRVDNRRAKSLYERNGYEKVGEVSDYYADGMTAFRYEKPLSPLADAGPVTSREPLRA